MLMIRGTNDGAVISILCIGKVLPRKQIACIIVLANIRAGIGMWAVDGVCKTYILECTVQMIKLK